MGVMTDFFLASSTDVEIVLRGWQLPPEPSSEVPEAVSWNHPPKPDPAAEPAPKIASLPNVQCRGMLPDKLALLFASLAEVPADRALDLVRHGFLTGPPETEVTVQKLPLGLTRALADAGDADLVRAAKVLAEDDIDAFREEFCGKSGEIATILQRVKLLARHGLSTNANLFLWTCT